MAEHEVAAVLGAEHKEHAAKNKSVKVDKTPEHYHEHASNVLWVCAVLFFFMCLVFALAVTADATHDQNKAMSALIAATFGLLSAFCVIGALWVGYAESATARNVSLLMFLLPLILSAVSAGITHKNRSSQWYEFDMGGSIIAMLATLVSFAVYSYVLSTGQPDTLK